MEEHMDRASNALATTLLAIFIIVGCPVYAAEEKDAILPQETVMTLNVYSDTYNSQSNAGETLESSDEAEAIEETPVEETAPVE